MYRCGIDTDMAWTRLFDVPVGRTTETTMLMCQADGFDLHRGYKGGILYFAVRSPDAELLTLARG